MRIRAFRHVPFEHLGLIEPALRRRGFEIEYADLYRHALPPGPADALIFMGGPMSANDDLPWLRQELGLIEQAAASGVPVLGVCLGAQLTARALGARVYRNPVKEIGWFPVYWTPAALTDRLFHALAQPETPFHWHGETYDLPAGAESLAWSDACRQQAFRYGESVYGMQFHIEVTAEMIRDWCGQPANQHDLRGLELPMDDHARAAHLATIAATVLDRWCDLVESCQHRPSS